ncbi:MAG: sigma-70 family RNA polymerase sigma factor, partial [Candidatus Hydrogenedentes bacterium]|nr:sigma-70 family RNA polymerase sigma factor [Candidatus Hydrogenedentota bacterium]
MPVREVILDRQAVQDVLSGERERFRELVERYMPVVQATAMARLRNVSDTEDVVQETFLRAFQSLDRLRAKEKFGAWLLTIARNVCNTLLARRGREASLHEATPPMAVEPSASGDAPELDGLLHEELLKLSEGHREVLLMHYFAGQSLAEMESLLGVSRLALAKRLQRARESLGERMLKRVEAGRYRPDRERVSTVMKAIVVAPVSWEATGAASLAKGAHIIYRARQLGELIMMHKSIAVPIVILAGFAATLALGQGPQAKTPSVSAALSKTVNQTAIALAAADDQPPAPAELAGAEAAATDPGDAAATAAEEPVDLTDPQDVWRKVVDVNNIWLDPHPKQVQYTFNMGGPEPGAQPELIYRVWIDGDKGRFETDSLEVIFDSRNSVYLQPPELLQKSPMPTEDASRFRQGVTWHTALHEFAEHGLPENARIVETRDTPAGKTIVIEAELEKTPGNVGFGLANMWFGESSFRIDRVRLHIQVPEFVPVLEEDFTRMPDGGENKNRIEIGPEFIDFQNQSAPKVLAFHTTFGDDIEWVLRAEFQKVDDVWILREGLNVHDGKLVNRVYVTNASTKPFSPDLVEAPTEEKLAELKAAFPKQDSAQKPAEGQPVVVRVFPANAASNVPVQTELRIQFDQPMDPGRMGITFEKGALRDFSAAQYDPESYEFVIPVRLTPGQQQFVAVNAERAWESFVSVDGVKAAAYRWGFETAAAPNTPGAPEPQILSLSPQPGEKVACFTYVEVAFDQPMDPLAGHIVDLSDEKSVMDRAQLLADVQYNAREKRFTLPVSLPPDWEGDVELRGFKTVEGASAAPVQLHLATTSVLFSETALEQFRKAGKDSQLLVVLNQMRLARQQLTALSERVTTMDAWALLPSAQSASTINTQSATFKFQGNGQFYGDVTQCMHTGTFVVASDGDQCWWHYTMEKNGQIEEFLQVAPYDVFDEKNVLICDPFGLQNRDVEEAIADLHLEYEGTCTLNGRHCHVIKSTTAGLCGKWVTARITRLWVDAQQLMPVQAATNQLEGRALYTFAFDRVNDPIPDAEFAPPSGDNIVLQPIDSLTDGYTTRFLTVIDGSSGEMSVRWGMT